MRRVRKRPVVIVCDAAVRHLRVAGDAQSVSVSVRIVGQYVAGRDRRIFVRREIVADRFRRVIDRVHRHADGGRVRAAVAVIHRIGKRVIAGEVRMRRVRKRPVVVVCDAAICRLRVTGDAQRIAVRIRDIAQHIARGDRRIFIRDQDVVYRVRRRVLWCDGGYINHHRV